MDHKHLTSWVAAGITIFKDGPSSAVSEFSSTTLMMTYDSRAGSDKSGLGATHRL